MATANAQIKVTADTKSAERSLKGFQGNITKMADTINEVFGAATIAVNGIKTAIDQAKFANEVTRLQKLVGTDIAQAMQRATGGTISQMDAMRVAARGMTGDFKLTKTELSNVAAAADDMGKTLGIDSVELMNRFVKAIQKGGIEELKDFNIQLEATGDKTKDAQAILEKFGEIASNPINADETADNLDKALTQYEDFINIIKESLGISIRWVTNFITDALTQWMRMFDRVGKKMSDMFGIKAGPSAKDLNFQVEEAEKLAGQKLVRDPEFLRQFEGVISRHTGVPLKRNPVIAGGQAREAFYQSLKTKDNSPEAAAFRAQFRRFLDVATKEVQDLNVEVEKSRELERTRLRKIGQAGGGGGDKEGTKKRKRRASIYAEETSFLAPNEVEGQGSTFSTEFGSLSGVGSATDFLDAQVAAQQMKQDEVAKETQSRMNMINESSENMASAFAAGVQAMIESSDGIVEAFTKAALGVLRAKAIESTVLAAFHLAAALGNSAFGNAPAAAQHFAASKSYAIAAVVAGAGAAALGAATGAIGGGGGGQGGGGGGGSARPPGGGGLTDGGGGREGGNKTVIIQVGNGFIGNEKKLGEEVSKAVDKADKSGFTSRIKGKQGVQFS